jgi:hypothetical protein
MGASQNVAHNTAFNYAINCTPFEAEHGLQASTNTKARAGLRLQIVAEGGMDLLEVDKNWEKILFLSLPKGLPKGLPVKRSANHNDTIA